MFEQLRRLEDGAHAVAFYESDGFVVDRVREFVATALADGEVAIVVATAEHRSAFARALTAAGVDLEAAIERHQYVALDASETLDAFMVDGSPDEDRFRRTVGALLPTATERGPRVRVYGEMVAVLWNAGNVAAAIALEDLWNGLAATHRFGLFCAYPMASFESATADDVRRVCDQHDLVIPGEAYLDVDDHARLREVARLQQAARAAAADRVSMHLHHADPVAVPLRPREPPVRAPRRRDGGGRGRTRRLLDRFGRALPRGGTLPEDVWTRRHAGILTLTAVHVPGIVVFGVLRGEHPGHVTLEASVIATLTVVSWLLRRRRQVTTVSAAVGLLSCSAVLVHLSGGAIEMHFHFFVMVAVITLYQAWEPFLAAISYVLVHHGVLGALLPGRVFNHPAAAESPWKWTAIHGFFILGMSVAGVLSWRLNEALWSTAVAGEQKLAEAQRIAGLGSWEWDLVSGRCAWSAELFRLCGLEPGSVEPSIEALLEAIHPEDRHLAEGAILRARDRSEAAEFEVRLSLPTGRNRWLHGQVQVTGSTGGQAVHLAGTALDVTERKLAEEALERSNAAARLLQRVTAAANEAVSFEAAMGLALYEVCSYLGWPLGHLYEVTDGGTRLQPSTIWWTADGDRFRAFMQGTEATDIRRGQGLPGRVLETGRATWVTDLAGDAANPRHLHARASGVGAALGFPLLIGDDVAAVVEFFSTEAREPDRHLLDVMEDVGMQLGRVTERWRAQRVLAHQALHDALTGLPNRALFIDRVTHAIAHHARRPTPAAVLFLDLDRFKLINDSLGHDAGDEVLVSVARRLEAAVRPSDTVARLGGDEFTILCDDLDRPEDAATLAERIVEAVAAPLRIKGRELVLTTSVGIAAVDAEASADGLLRDADMAMYRAKQDGRNRTALFDPAMHEAARQRLETANALRTALKGNELRLHYQPQVSLADGAVVGVEALLRWDRPGHGLVPPLDFIPLAEESDLIIDIGNWVVREACRQAAQWDVESAALAGMAVSVNISARQLTTPDLIDVVSDSLRTTGLHPSRLCLEITETVVMLDAEASYEALTGLKLLGVSLAIDDFGTGYSSLSYLQRLPVRVLKIDKSFVGGVSDNPSNLAIVRSVVDLARALHLIVVAEGVETAGEAAVLADIGCHRAQGHWFARASTPQVLETLASDWPASLRGD